MRPGKRLFLWVAASAGVFLLVTVSTLVVHSRAKLDFSRLDLKTQPFYRAAAQCQLLASTKVDIWAGHDVRMNRYSCDQAAAKRLPPDALQFDSVLQDCFNIEAFLFVEQTWLSKKVLLSDSSCEYQQVVYSSIDVHPSVLLTKEVGATAFVDWRLITGMPNGGIGAAKRPEKDHRNNVRLAANEDLDNSIPSIRGNELIVESEIRRPDDANCCPSGGVVQSHYSLNQGVLKIAFTKRLTSDQAKRIAQDSLPPEAPVSAPVASTTTPGLTHIGAFTDPPNDVNIGVPCPDADMHYPPQVHKLPDTPNVKSCDHVFIFRELKGNKMHLFMFLYRGSHPPATLRELCQVRFTGDLFTLPNGTDINSQYILKIAPKLPQIESVEEVSGQEKSDFLAAVGATQWRVLQAQGIVFFNKARAAKRYWY